MARNVDRLTDRTVRSLGPGRHLDGHGLYLEVDMSGARRWVLRYRLGKRRRDMGLGSYPAITLARARELAGEARVQIAADTDPIDARRSCRRDDHSSFGAVAASLHAAKRQGWTSARYSQQWLDHLERHAGPLWHKHVSEIDVNDVIGVLHPIWVTKPATAMRLREKIETVLDASRVKGLIQSDRANPARLKGNIGLLLPRQPKLIHGHRRSVAYCAVPAFIAELHLQDSIGAACMEWLVLTACRSNEALEARWIEIDSAERIWTIPANRTKTRAPHRVPLAPRCLEILARVARVRDPASPYIFPGLKSGRPPSSSSLRRLVGRMKVDACPHGFRSSFRVWCAEHNIEREAAELCLGHSIASAVERAYQRSDLLARRRQIMHGWAAFCEQARAPLEPQMGSDRDDQGIRA